MLPWPPPMRCSVTDLIWTAPRSVMGRGATHPTIARRRRGRVQRLRRRPPVATWRWYRAATPGCSRWRQPFASRSSRVPRPGVDVEIVPGVTAMLAVAARVGAPLGHDFCALSLSDNLKPWPVIERRLDAAAQAGFVIALYNPI